MTSEAAYHSLENIMKRNCARVMNINYGLQILPETVLHISNTEEFRWLLQPELKAIKDGLIFVVKDNGGDKYVGYLNAQGQRQGVGIMTYRCVSKEIGEWHEDRLHGSVKEE